MNKSYLHKEVWVPSESSFQLKEKVTKEGKKKKVLEGMMLPFEKVSRNKVLYNKESIEKKCKELVGKPLMYNHMVEGNALPYGHFTDSYCKEDGWYYEADIDPQEENFIRKLERGDLRHVSIQLVGGKVVEREDKNTGQSFTEAWVEDVIEGSVVPAPGFLDTTAQFAEAFKKGKINEEEKKALLKAEPELKKEIEEKRDGTGPHGRGEGPGKGKGKDSPECPENEEEAVEEVIECPRCRQSFYKKDGKCPKCGWKVKEEIDTSTADGAVADAKIVKPKKKEEKIKIKEVLEFIENATKEELIEYLKGMEDLVKNI